MGIKSLTLQMFPWCFHLMGCHVSSCINDLNQDKPIKTIKLIKSDGLVKIYHKPINASDLMIEFPKHLVCSSDSFYIGQKIPSLSENDQLQLGQNYFLLPKQFFQSVLSFVTIASFASSPSSSLRNSNNAILKKAASCQPFDIRKTSSGSLQIRVSDDFISKLIEEGNIKDEEEERWEESRGRICTTPRLQKDYIQLVGSRQWKPKLETIREPKRRKLASFGIKRRKKSQSKVMQTSHISEKLLPTSTPSSKSSSRSRSKEKKGSKI